jgi:hypothetical protein
MHGPENRTIKAIFSHPLQHGIRYQDVDAMMRALGGSTSVEGHRIKLTLPVAGQTWLDLGNHSEHRELDADKTMQLRRFLQKAGVDPDNPLPPQIPIHGDQAIRLVLHLSHRNTDAYQLIGQTVDHAVLKAQGLWGSDQNLSHRHERDIAGQKAPTDYAYLHRLASAIEAADAVLLIGHGHGESDMRHHLLDYLKNHHPHLLKKIKDVTTAKGTSLHEGELLAIARQAFGNKPDRHMPVQH